MKVDSDSLNLGYSGTVKPNNLISTIDTWGPEYTVVVDIILHSDVSEPPSELLSILRFANGHGDIGDIGQRVPAILYQREQRILQIASAVNDNGDYYVTHNIDLNKWYHIEINQEKNIANGKVSEFN